MIIFFYGTNTYELRRGLSQMTQAYVRKAGSDLGLERIDGSAVKPAAILASLQAAPFLASSRLVVIEEFAATKPTAEVLERLFAGVPETTVAVFVETKIDQRTSVYKQLLKADKVVKFEPLHGAALERWMQSEARLAGAELSAASARQLVDLAGEDQWLLANEINRLAFLGEPITPELVREHVAGSFAHTIFELTDAMTAGKIQEALRIWRRLVENRESEMYVLVMITWQLRNLLLAKAAPSAMSPADVAAAAGISPYVAGKMAEAQGRIDERVLRRGISLAAACEMDIKTGKAKAEAAVERLIVTIAGMVR